jgi:coproporphyrinogen III oxidase-like Fe-S oxidoreductase
MYVKPMLLETLRLQRHLPLPMTRKWQRLLSHGTLPTGGSETLTAENRAAEAVYLGLRTIDGLSVSVEERRRLQRWAEAGWIEDVGTASQHRVRCTPYGWLRLDGLAADLTARRSHS